MRKRRKRRKEQTGADRRWRNETISSGKSALAAAKSADKRSFCEGSLTDG